MKKEKEEEKSEHPKNKHRLVKQEQEETKDGKHIIHHHEYEDEKGARHRRMNVAVSSSPEEAGEHVSEQFGMNQPPEEGDPGEGEGAAPGEGAPPADGAAPAQ